MELGPELDVLVGELTGRGGEVSVDAQPEGDGGRGVLRQPGGRLLEPTRGQASRRATGTGSPPARSRTRADGPLDELGQALESAGDLVAPARLLADLGAEDVVLVLGEVAPSRINRLTGST